MRRNNERVMMASLLKDLLRDYGGYFSMRDVERIEKALSAQPPFRGLGS